MHEHFAQMIRQDKSLTAVLDRVHADHFEWGMPNSNWDYYGQWEMPNTCSIQ